jgi:hypothetical protein
MTCPLTGRERSKTFLNALFLRISGKNKTAPFECLSDRDREYVVSQRLREEFKSAGLHVSILFAYLAGVLRVIPRGLSAGFQYPRGDAPAIIADTQSELIFIVTDFDFDEAGSGL